MKKPAISQSIAALAVCAGLALGAAGCAPTALRSARAQIAAGNYTHARPELIALAAHPDRLSPAELREVKDDLCVGDYTIGAPTYSLADQRRVCLEASRIPGSTSGPVLARINTQVADSDAAQVESALKHRDLAGAETATEDYESIPGADSAKVSHWTQQMWRLVDTAPARRGHAARANLAGAISTLKREQAHTRTMSETAFFQWVLKTATVDGTPLIDEPRLAGKGTLRLRIADDSLSAAALNLDRFAQINDGLAARCGCDAHTDVGIGQSEMPAYVARLDPENRRSEVLILISGEKIGPRISER